MEQINIKRPVLNFSDSSLDRLLAICCVFPVLILWDVSGIEPRQLPKLLFIAGFIGCTFLLYAAIKKILMIPKRTYLAINDDCIIIYDRGGQWEINFSEVSCFECGTLRLWRFNMRTNEIIVHLKNGNGYVKTFSAAGITIKQQELCDILNERLNSYKRNEKKYPTR